MEKPKSDKSEEMKYELWTGSANATPRGLGWNFKNHTAECSASIECLVKFDIRKDEFDVFHKSIENDYRLYNNFSSPSNFKPAPDKTGPYIVNNFKCQKISYDTDTDTNLIQIKITLKKQAMITGIILIYQMLHGDLWNIQRSFMLILRMLKLWETALI